MVKVENLSFSYPDRDLYDQVSFEIEEGQHCALIGSNGCGKSTLADLLLHTEEYLYDGRITKDPGLKIGYVSQFIPHDHGESMTVFQFLCQDFEEMQARQDAVCAEMETSEDPEIFERYQVLLDEFEAVDGYNYESNIHRQLHLGGLTALTEVPISKISGGEYKLVSIIRQMMQTPGLLIMDEPDVYLDFENLRGLRDLINQHKGTLLVITHNRYLLNHCFDRILHLEHGDLQQFEGTYSEYNLVLLQMKIEMQEQSVKDSEWIETQEKLVEKLRKEATYIDNPAKGRQLKARASYLERLRARQIKPPFVDIPRPRILLPSVWKPETEEEAGKEALTALPGPVLTVADYGLSFDRLLLEHVSFEIGPHDKVALVGANGTGKTTLLRAIYQQAQRRAALCGPSEDPGAQTEEISADPSICADPSISLNPAAKTAFLSQLHGEMLDEEKTVIEEFLALGFDNERQIREYLADYCFEPDHLKNRIGVLSGGEKNLLQLAEIGLGKADFLLLDEPTSHLDLNAQKALEEALAAYRGAVLMVTHDFYTAANCADYVLMVEHKTIRRMSGRAFRKMIYRDHFGKDYLEQEQQKKELQIRAEACLKNRDYEGARKLCGQLEGAGNQE